MWFIFMNTKLLRLMAFSPAIILLLLIFMIFISEVYKLAIEKNPEVVASYHFGSEAMAYHGGQIYKNIETYVTVNLILSIAALGGMLGSLIILLRLKTNALLMAYSVAVITVACPIILGKLL